MWTGRINNLAHILDTQQVVTLKNFIMSVRHTP